MLTLQDAKDRFSAVVDAAMSGRTQEIWLHGRPAVVVISVDEYHRLVDAASGKRGSFIDHLMAFPGKNERRAKAAPRDAGRWK